MASSGDKALPPPSFSRATTKPWDDRPASNGGRGTDDALTVTQIFSKHPTSHVVSWVFLLSYSMALPECVRLADHFFSTYQDWEICVPTEVIDKAVNLLQKEPHSTNYSLVEAWSHPSTSLLHTYHRFQGKDTDFYFIMVPAQDVHIVCEPSNITRSLRGLPYPKLNVFIQSCLDTRNETQLCDVVDGTNLPEQWREENLDLEGFNDVEWAKDMNKRGREFENGKFAHWAPFAWDAQRIRRDMWQSTVRTKKDRLDWTKPSDIYVTQYRIVDDPDPWTIMSEEC